MRLGVSKTEIASCFGAFLECEYRSSILFDMCPLRALIIAPEACPSPSIDTKQWRRSCQRQDTLVAFLATVQPVFQLRIGFFGSVP